MSDTESESSDSETEIIEVKRVLRKHKQVVEAKPTQIKPVRKTKKERPPPVETTAESTVEKDKKPRKPLSDAQRQALRDRLQSARDKKQQIKQQRELEHAKSLVDANKSKRATKKKNVAEPVAEPVAETPAPPKAKRVYKKKTVATNPF